MKQSNEKEKKDDKNEKETDEGINNETNETKSGDDNFSEEEKNVFSKEFLKKINEELEKTRERENIWRQKCSDLINQRTMDQKMEKNRIKYSNENLLEKIIFFFDNFERTVEVLRREEIRKNEEEKKIAKNFLRSFQINVEEFFKLLTEQGVKKMKVIPYKDFFDPEKHKMIKESQLEEYQDGIILKVFQSGFYLHDRVLRPAWVEKNSKKKIKKRKKVN